MILTIGKIFFNLLENSPIKSVPHVHLRDDFHIEELDLLFDKYGTRLFNLHTNVRGEDDLTRYAKYKEYIYYENQKIIDDRFFGLINISAGMCVDFSHLEDYWVRREQNNYLYFEEVMKNHHIGCCHVSGVSNELVENPYNGESSFAVHQARSEKDFDYLKKYKEFLPPYISLELENSFHEQMKFREYIYSMLNQ